MTTPSLYRDALDPLLEAAGWQWHEKGNGFYHAAASLVLIVCGPRHLRIEDDRGRARHAKTDRFIPRAVASDLVEQVEAIVRELTKAKARTT